MARFIFSMQNLLDMKEKLEEQEKNNYSRANLRLLEAEEEWEMLKGRQRDAEEALREEMEAVLDMEKIRQCRDAVEILKMYVRQQQLVVLQREKEVEVARKRLNEAMIERKTFEKLREKAYEAFLEEENIKERKEVDELVSYRYGSSAEQNGGS